MRPIVRRTGNHQIRTAEFFCRVGACDWVKRDQTRWQSKCFLDTQTARLIECDMAVASDTEKLHVQSPIGLDPTVEVCRVCGGKRLGYRAVEDVRSMCWRSTWLNRQRCIYEW